MEMMSLKRSTYVTTRYDVYGGFYVEVTKNPEKIMSISYYAAKITDLRTT